MKESSPRVPSLCFYQGKRDGRIEEILEVLLPPSDNVPSRGQQLPTPTVNSVGKALLPPPEALDGVPESLQGQLVVPGSAQARVFASATAQATPCLASRCPSATSGVPQANHSR
ncbi:hypothetical protein ILYODFUR_019738 [Ilyodon furcidens]|uniref:Uncharacterized protein n=1 Tax=Ilyodon furcidens TaxID=33524 RepID=A0ABV0SMQ0_9TELE